MEHMKYTFNVSPAGNRDIYRIIVMDGRDTLRDLAEVILKAFDFDDEHLYMFSLKRKRYDPEGFYSPESHEARNAARARIMDLELKARRKFLFLYDFGDEWMFDITTGKILKSDERTQIRVLEEKGRLNQYGWDEEEGNDEDAYDEDAYDEDAYEEALDEDADGEVICEDDGCDNDLLICLKEADESYIEKRLENLPPSFQDTWLRLVYKEMQGVDGEESVIIRHLEQAGLVRTEESQGHLMVEVKCKDDRNIPYQFLDGLSSRTKAERETGGLLGIYGIVEPEELFRMVREQFNCAMTETEWMNRILRPGGEWGLWYLTEAKGRILYAGAYPPSISDLILKAREKYPVKWYRPLTGDEAERISRSGAYGSTPAEWSVFNLLIWEKGWSPEDAAGFLNQFRVLCHTDMEEEKIIEQAGKSVRKAYGTFTKHFRIQLSNLRLNLPSGSLKGYTWNEYGKERLNGYHQISLFDEERPF